MVVTERPRQALIVPDEATWTMAGHDPAGLGLTPVAGAETAEVLLAPSEVPESLASFVAGERSRSPGLQAVGGMVDLPLRGRLLGDVVGGAPAAAGEDPHAGHEMHGGHDMRASHDMMAIVGEPSADGLVMEPIDFRFGPVTGVLPGGLVIEVSLDGDVVASARVRALLHGGVDGPRDEPDLLTPIAWQVAVAVAAEHSEGATPPARLQWERVAAVEIERSLSHLAWLRSLARNLGWAQLVALAQRAIVAVAPHAGLPAPPDGRPSLAAAEAAVTRVRSLVEGRRFAARTRVRGVIADGALAGPNARAASIGVDTREEDPLYRDLGFEAVTEEAGDARARSLARIFEAQASLGLARLALERAHGAAGAGTLAAFAIAGVACVEGPRGPLLAIPGAPGRAVRFATPGTEAARAAAGAAMVGLEWSAALVVATSFDLSPWAVA